MTAISPIHALTADGRLASKRPRPTTDPDRAVDAPISPLVVYPVAAAVSLALWFALAELVMLAARLPLFSRPA
jgi:hypothetical protein